jgi:1,4-alpha-glucan branching enzyme
MIKTTRTTRKTKTDVMKPEPEKAEAMKVEPAKTMSIKIEPMQASAPAKLESFKAPAPKGEKPRVNLSLMKPDAKKVCVAGSFNEWKPDRTPLKPAGNGRWIGDLTIDPGKYEYLFVVDGQWLPDPNAKESVQNPFGGRNSVLVVSA